LIPHLGGSAQLEHERVIAGIGAHVQYSLSLQWWYLRGQALPAGIVAPGAADDEIPGEPERTLKPWLELFHLLKQTRSLLLVKSLGQLSEAHDLRTGDVRAP
jgi:hypothetical protein